MMQVYDRVLPTRHIETLIALSVLLAAALITVAILEAVRSSVFSRYGNWVMQKLEPAALERVMEIASRAGDARSAQALRDLATVRGFLSSGGPAPIFDLPFVPMFYAILFIIHPWLGWLVVGGGLIVVALTLLTEKVTHAKTMEIGAVDIRAQEEADILVRMSDVVKSMGMMPAINETRGRAAAKLDIQRQRLSDLAGMFSAAVRFLRYALQSAVLALAALLVVQDQLTGGMMIAASIISTRAIAPVEQLIGGWRMLTGARIAWRRTLNLFQRVPAAQDSMTLPEPRGRVSGERLTWGPPGASQAIIKGMSFAIEPGEFVGIIGYSGAGKSTLLRLITGSLYPSSGAIRIDGADVNRLSAQDRARFLGYLPQDVELLTGTVRQNIARFREATDQQVTDAATRAGAHELILSLPQGYETPIGLGGVPLSGGQRQRVGLARALFGNPAVVVLDEPDASLDAVGEKALVDAIAMLRQRKVTVIVVTQRLGAVGQADRLMVVKDGMIELYGPRDAVIQKIRAAGVQDIKPAASATAAQR
jgi:PrtD family type I secretion system ABC transporter